MSDHLSWETQNDLVDGVLPRDERQAAEAHLARCVACASAVSALRATIDSTRALPESVDPPDELWSGVRTTIEAGKVAPLGAATQAPRGWWVTVPRMAVAASLLVVAASSVTAYVMQARPSGVVASPVPALPVSWQVTEQGYQASVLDLREQLALLHDKLSPATITAVEQSLATIDVAIAEAREALLRDPANAALPELLASNYRQKIELLRRATQLPSTS